MIKEYATDIAEQLGIKLTKVSLIDGKLLGCRDSHLVQLYSEGLMESVLIYQRELDALQNGISPDPLETRIRAALTRLKTLLG